MAIADHILSILVVCMCTTLVECDIGSACAFAEREYQSWYEECVLAPSEPSCSSRMQTLFAARPHWYRNQTCGDELDHRFAERCFEVVGIEKCVELKMIRLNELCDSDRECANVVLRRGGNFFRKYLQAIDAVVRRALSHGAQLLRGQL